MNYLKSIRFVQDIVSLSHYILFVILLLVRIELMVLRQLVITIPIHFAWSVFFCFVCFVFFYSLMHYYFIISKMFCMSHFSAHNTETFIHTNLKFYSLFYYVLQSLANLVISKIILFPRWLIVLPRYVYKNVKWCLKIRKIESFCQTLSGSWCKNVLLEIIHAFCLPPNSYWTSPLE